MKKLSLVAILIAVTLSSFAQYKREEKKEKKDAKREKINDMVRQAEEGILVYRKQSIFGLQLRTNGYGLFYELGRMKTNRKTNIYRIDITEMKNAKEEKVLGTGPFFGNPYIYGKVNYFYPVTLGFGQQYILGQKGNKNGVAVTAVYNAGLSLGLLRPYYVNVENTAGGQDRAIRYKGDDTTLFLDQSAIRSGGGFGKGWSQIKVEPGGFAKVAMRFDYGRYNESVAGLEIGMSVEAYANKIQILALQDDKRFFFQGYIAILFGKRK